MAGKKRDSSLFQDTDSSPEAKWRFDEGYEGLPYHPQDPEAPKSKAYGAEVLQHNANGFTEGDKGYDNKFSVDPSLGGSQPQASMTPDRRMAAMKLLLTQEGNS